MSIEPSDELLQQRIVLQLPRRIQLLMSIRLHGSQMRAQNRFLQQRHQSVQERRHLLQLPGAVHVQLSTGLHGRLLPNRHQRVQLESMSEQRHLQRARLPAELLLLRVSKRLHGH